MGGLETLGQIDRAVPESRLDRERHLPLWYRARDREITEARREAPPRLTMLVHLLVLNFDGRRLLQQCLPSVVDAARASRHQCRVAVVDNDSRDDSVAWLAGHYPQVRVIRRPNRGLCSFNEVVPALEGRVAVLLNNDVKLDPHCVDPLVEPLVCPPPEGGSPCFMTAPACWLFDGATYEGFKTAVGWRWGLVWATALFPGHEAAIRRAGLTASAGAVLAVDRRKFAELGGFDPLFLPGRLEDLDFAFRGYLAGYHARYVPDAVAYHRGMATFGAVFGRSGCDQLALRNTLLFQWKNLRHPAHLARQALGLPVRLVLDLVRAPSLSPAERWAFARALLAALSRWGQMRVSARRVTGSVRSEREFFRTFSPSRILGGLSEREGLFDGAVSEGSVSEGDSPIFAPRKSGQSPSSQSPSVAPSIDRLAAVGTTRDVPRTRLAAVGTTRDVPRTRLAAVGTTASALSPQSEPNVEVPQ